MQARFRHIVTRALALGALGFGVVGAGWSQGSTTRVEMPEGTVVPVRLDNSISSKSRVGTRFSATVRTDDSYYSAFPRGTKINGTVTDSAKATKDRPGMLRLRFDRVTFPDGRTATINGTLVGLDNLERTDNGRLISTGKQDKTPESVAIGAIGGLVIGTITNKPIEGALIGAAAGYLYSLGQKGKGDFRDIDLRSGTDFGVRLDRRLVFQGYRNNRDDDWYRDNRNNRDDDWYRDNRNERRDRDDDWYSRDRWDRNDDRPYIGRLYAVRVNGREIEIDESRQPFESNGTLFVPAAEVLDALGFRYTYNERDRILSVDADRGQVEARVDSRRAYLDGARRNLAASPVYRGDRLYVPVDFFELVTGSRPSWNRGSRTLTITDDRREW